MVEIFVNNVKLRVPRKSTVLEACDVLGVVVPRFCYHHRLNIAGNCRICLVEIEKSPKPQVSCAFPVVDNIRVFTETPLVRKAREAVLEFLLLNHPLDCPICDQGGECDLQDQTISFGSDRSRLYIIKRSVEDKNLGPFVKTIITRCIHCTRCVRFSSEIAGIETLGTTLRGRQIEIGTYVNKDFNSEISANIVDLCPVGALTSKPYAFQARPWELDSVESIDTTDGSGSHIRVDRKGRQIVRILSRRYDKINQEWLTDKARFVYDGIYRQRLISAYWKKEKLRSWKQVGSILIKLFHIPTTLILSNSTDIETIGIAKNIGRQLGWDVIAEENQGPLSLTPIFYITCLPIHKCQEADTCFLVGVNPRTEATIANLRLRQACIYGKSKIINLASLGDLTYSTVNLGLHPGHIIKWIEGYVEWFNCTQPLIVYGDSLRYRQDGASLHSGLRNFHQFKARDNWTGWWSLGRRSNTIGAQGLGFSKNSSVSNPLNYLLCNEEPKWLKKTSKIYNIYQGSHADTELNKNCDLLIPAATSLEQRSTYINWEGCAQRTQIPGVISHTWRSNYAILQWIKEEIKLQKGVSVYKSVPSLEGRTSLSFLKLRRPTKIIKTGFKNIVTEVLRTDRLTKASAILAKASSIQRRRAWNFGGVVPLMNNFAGNENRTHAPCLASRRSTTNLYPL